MRRFLLWWMFFWSICTFGQNQPTIHHLENGFEFNNLQLDQYTVSYQAASSCSFGPTKFYKYFSFKAGFDMTFAFDLESDKTDFKFILWKLEVDEPPESVFYGTSTITADRSVEHDESKKIGLREGESDGCETYNNGNGYAKAFMGDELLRKGETIVIAVYGNSDQDPFSIRIHAAVEKEITYNTHCEGDPYSIATIIEQIKDETNFENIKIFTDFDQSTEYTEPEVTTAQTLYAFVRDDNDVVKYLYHLHFTFTPRYEFDDKLKPNATLTACKAKVPFDKNQFLAAVLTDIDFDNFEILKATYNDGNGERNIDLTTPFDVPNPSEVKLKLRYKGSSTFCTAESDWIPLKLENSIPKFDDEAKFQADKCEGDAMTMTQLEELLKVDTSLYQVKLTGYNAGQPINFEANQTFIFQVKMVNKNDGSCESESKTFTVNKTNPIQLVSAKLHQECLNELTQSDVDQAIETILDGTTATLTFFGDADKEIEESGLLAYIQTKKQGTIQVVGELDGFCNTTVKLTFDLAESSVVIPTTINPLKSTCLDAEEEFDVSESDLKKHLDTIFGANHEYVFIDNPDVMVKPNTEKIIRFKVRESGEKCWSDEVRVEIISVNKPGFEIAISDQIANCDNQFEVTSQWLKEKIGENVLNYTIYINNQEFIIPKQVLTLDFSSSDEIRIPIEIRNPNDATCKIVGEFTIKQAAQFTDEVANTQKYLEQNSITFCEGELPETWVQERLDYIKTQHPGVEFSKTAMQIAQEMTANNGKIAFEISRAAECGSITLYMPYTKVDLPTVALDDLPKVCAGELLTIDLSDLDSSFTYYVEDDAGVRIDPENGAFELPADRYTLYAENASGCKSNPYHFTIETYPEPKIKSISIENGNLTVVAEGNGGKLEYSLDGEHWQSSNTFRNIQKGMNYTVWVRENGCGGVSVSNIYVLNLPNFISPNGDGRNDVWQPIGHFVNDKVIRFQVFDRYGKSILKKEGIDDVLFWDGKQNGSSLPSGDYWYSIDYPTSNDNMIEINIKYSGNITVKNK
ncbi:T9SS type B sorting domain-containing protein [Vaginella massiliensis]|uniref:T9SS type B sorting domain-containing protein n=1 Tax=Vaginella massiliensis TaxID=1816680 RepID=UPI003752F803